MDTSFVNREDIIYEDDLIEQNDISSESEEDTEIYIMKHENKEAAFSDIQYSMGRPDGRNRQNKTTSSYLGNIAIRNLIKTYFGTEYLADAHASLNNAALCDYVDKIQKEIHPQGANTIAYQRMFHALFDLIKQLTGSSVQFQRLWYILLKAISPKGHFAEK
ncbi:hypothetical protein RhiirA4_462226 [Rhizophagus irregularis]|uniref:Uncharacterized protein n=1 Tax=Rhizophagus irregularis TaxID=588596 RepID=A0A2I1GKH2_9GLOM|nr:hypothetical protein RhiirA4_462226 [Rhizophagus irregularis]